MALMCHRLWQLSFPVQCPISSNSSAKRQLAENDSWRNVNDGMTRDFALSGISCGVSARRISRRALPQGRATGYHEEDCMEVAGASSGDSLEAAGDVLSTRLGRRWLLGVMAASLVGWEVPKLGALELPEETEKEYEEDEQRTVQLFQDATRSVVSIQDLAVLSPRKGGKSAVGEETVKVEGIGSGFVWDTLGHIVTNYHVVAKLAMDSSGKQRAQVSLLGPDGQLSVHEAKLVGIDSTRDIAVLKIDVPVERLRPLPLGTSEDLRVGQSCYAVGNPYGYEHTLTTGVVSGLGREIPSPSGKPIPGAIQTDAAINAGNSGGPLLDSFGRTIGINTATFTRQGSGMSSGVNFAVPVDSVRRIVPRLIVYGTASSSKPTEPRTTESSAESVKELVSSP